MYLRLIPRLIWFPAAVTGSTGSGRIYKKIYISLVCLYCTALYPIYQGFGHNISEFYGWS